MKQTVTSANTSINTTKLPAIYKKINWEQFRDCTVLDYGCGKLETVKLILDFLRPYNIKLLPFDPFNLDADMNYLTHCSENLADVVICSNVLNVIDSHDAIQDVIDYVEKVTGKNKVFFFKIYEGNKSGAPKYTKKDCFQQNQKTNWYLENFNWKNTVVSRSGIITNRPNFLGKSF